MFKTNDSNKKALIIFAALVFGCVYYILFFENNMFVVSDTKGGPFKEKTDIYINVDDLNENEARGAVPLICYSGLVVNRIVLVFLYLPITFYFIKKLTNSSRTPRRPPVKIQGF